MRTRSTDKSSHSLPTIVFVGAALFAWDDGGRGAWIQTETLADLDDLSDNVGGIVFAPDGKSWFVARSVDGTLYVSGGNDGRVRWFSTDGRPLADEAQDGPVDALAVSPAGDRIVVATSGRIPTIRYERLVISSTP